MLVRGIWLESIGAIFFGVCTSLIALIVGRDFGDLLVELWRRNKQSSGARSCTEQDDDALDDGREKCFRSRVVILLVLATVFITLLAGTIVAAVLDRESDLRRSFWASSMFAPVGAILRWRLSALNRIRPTFPFGTFLANMAAMLLDVAIGSALLANPSSSDARLFLSALITGLGGSLSTVSTWLAEAVRLRRLHKYQYIVGTISSAQVLGLLVFGSTYWSVVR